MDVNDARRVLLSVGDAAVPVLLDVIEAMPDEQRQLFIARLLLNERVRRFGKEDPLLGLAESVGQTYEQGVLQMVKGMCGNAPPAPAGGPIGNVMALQHGLLQHALQAAADRQGLGRIPWGRRTHISRIIDPAQGGRHFARVDWLRDDGTDAGVEVEVDVGMEIDRQGHFRSIVPQQPG